jgi:hypothetical protein
MTFVTQHPSSFDRHLEKAINRKSRVLPAGAGKPWDAEDQSFISDFEKRHFDRGVGKEPSIGFPWSGAALFSSPA